jgi:Dihydropteroate synthase and related enzymes
MHSLSAPVDPSLTPRYDDVVDEVQNVLNERILRAQRAGISRDKIVIDPGLGFGKTSQQSFELVDRIHEFDSLCCPLLIGHSRKSMLKNISSPESDRLPATVAVTTLVAHSGVEIVRVHDVEENAAAVRSAATQTR